MVCYGRITLVAWQHHIRIGMTSSVSKPAMNTAHYPPTSLSSQPKPTDDTIDKANAEFVRHQFKAIRLTAAIVGTYTVFQIPYVVCNSLRSAGIGQQSLSMGYALVASGGFSSFYYAFNWVIYGLVSSKFRNGLIELFKRRQ
jgi:hypothetical protein